MIRQLPLFLIFLGLSCAARAVPVRFVPLNDEIAARNIGIRDAKGERKLEDLSSNKRSNVYECTVGETPLRLVLDRADPEAEPTTVEIPLAADIKAPLVLILPDADHPGGLRALAVEDSEAGFAWGCLLVVNLTKEPLVLRHEEESTPIPGELQPLKIELGGEARNMGVQMHKEGDPDTVLYSAVWDHDPNVRKLIFVTLGTGEDETAYDLRIIPEDKRVED